MNAVHLERFLRKVDAAGECLVWTGAHSPTGYGQMRLTTDSPTGKLEAAHRLAYEHFVGQIPEGYEVDHTCHNVSDCPGGHGCPHRRCVTPSHLEAVTHKVNVLRGKSTSALHAKKTHCPREHPYDADNTYVDTRGYRVCRVCMRLKSRASHRAKPRRTCAYCHRRSQKGIYWHEPDQCWSCGDIGACMERVYGQIAETNYRVAREQGKGHRVSPAAHVAWMTDRVGAAPVRGV